MISADNHGKIDYKEMSTDNGYGLTAIFPAVMRFFRNRQYQLFPTVPQRNGNRGKRLQEKAGPQEERRRPMQFNGIGSGHDSEMHHITKCMHDHDHYKKQVGAASAGAAGMEAQAMEMMQEQEGELSLSAWLDKMLGNGKRFLHGIWNGGGEGTPGSDSGKADAAQVMAQVGDVSTTARSGVSSAGQDNQQPDMHSAAHVSQIAAASATVPLPKTIQDNPYFSAIESAGGQETLLQKMRVKFKDITGQLSGHLPGKFFSAQNRNSFQAKQERPKEDLRKHSRFHGDELEIDCILTDDSYLLDSYDRKGEYSKLSAKK